MDTHMPDTAEVHYLIFIHDVIRRRNVTQFSAYMMCKSQLSLYTYIKFFSCA